MVLGLVLSLAHLLLSARGHVAEFEGDSLTTILESASLPTLIEFYAPWCQHCRAFEPILERVSGAVGGHMAVVRVNGEQFGAVADEWRVQSYPTLVFVPSGVVHRHPDATIEYEGSLLEKDVLDWISHAMRHAIHLKHFADLSTPEADKQNLKPPPPPSFTDMLPNQSNEFFLRLENLRRSNYLCDAVLVPSGNPVAIASHAVVLAATSPVLAALLGASNNDDTNSDADSSVLDRIDVSVDANHQVEVNFSRIGFDQSTIEALVEFAYTRSFSSSRCESESLPSITRALELLEIREVHGAPPARKLNNAPAIPFSRLVWAVPKHVRPCSCSAQPTSNRSNRFGALQLTLKFQNVLEFAPEQEADCSTAHLLLLAGAMQTGRFGATANCGSSCLKNGYLSLQCAMLGRFLASRPLMNGTCTLSVELGTMALDSTRLNASMQRRKNGASLRRCPQLERGAVQR
eukprot:c13857_g1_i2.p1 GENE.c13857_g1_i2~~c13857_g1_i2.p1  ORF type:complete len:461 (+),score=100.16 c13857_g1_i2:34-1416(+)